MPRAVAVLIACLAALTLAPAAVADAQLRKVSLLDPFSADHGWPLANPGDPNLPGVADADIDAEEAWELSTGKGVTVALVDSGVDAAHSDLAANVVTDGAWDFVGNDANPEDSNGHGTHAAGVIAAAANGSGITGVAPDARILPFKVLGGPPGTNTLNIVAAFKRAGDLGVRIVSASVGGPWDNPEQAAAIAAHPGTLYVVSAGNAGADLATKPHYPCAHPQANVLCVGASDGLDQRDKVSNWSGTSVDLIAPGRHVLSAAPASMGMQSDFPGLFFLSGTSSAAPHVAGVAALLASAHPDWGPLQIKQRIMDTVDALPALQGLSVSGGRLNAARALGVAQGAPAAPTGLRVTPKAGVVTATWTPNAENDIAGYRVSVAGRPPAETEATTYAVAGKAPLEFKVSAVDLLGNESPAAVASATPEPPPPTKLSKVMLRRKTLRFSLSAAAKVTFTLKRSGRRALARTRSYKRGTHRVAVRSRFLGIKLSKGRWTLKVSIQGAKPRTVRFTVK